MSRLGYKAFNRYDVKVVEFGSFVYIDDDEEVFRPATPEEDRNEQVDLFHAGYRAILHCPRTEDDRVNITSEFRSDMNKVAALGSVRKLAGRLLCHDCRFSTMTPIQVSIERTNIANAETERIKSFKLRQEAISELEERGLRFGAEDH